MPKARTKKQLEDELSAANSRIRGFEDQIQTIDEAKEDTDTISITPAGVELVEESGYTADEIVPAESYKSMDAALLDAQRNIVGIFKDSTTKSGPRFKYTRGESMIKFARTVLLKFGVVVHENGNVIEELPSQRLVMHGSFHIGYPASGESRVIERSHMIVTHSEKDNPIRTADKAAHGASTENFAYFLRGLLAVPRFEDDEDMNATAGVTETENFTTPQPTRPASDSTSPVGGNKAAESLPPIRANKVSFMTDELTADLRTMIRQTNSNEAKMLGYYKVASIGFLTKLQHEHLMQVLNTKLEASNIAAEVGGKVTKLAISDVPDTPHTGEPTLTPIPAGEETLNPQQQELVQKSLEAKGKMLKDLLGTFAYACVADIEISMFSKVMAWVRK